MQIEAIERRLDEWGRWARSFGKHRGHCMSLEGRYRSPQHWDPITSVPAGPVNADRCMQVEHIVIALDELYRVTITLVYVRRVPDVGLRHRLRHWRVRDPAPLLAEAVRRVGERLAPCVVTRTYQHPSGLEREHQQTP